MAYDPVKAHEYYMKYRKKGLKKGRKKGRTVSLRGVSAYGLNSDGAVEAAYIKERLKAEMNAKLKGAKTDAERMAIQKEYAKKANAEIAKLKADPKYAKAKATRASKAAKATKAAKEGKVPSSSSNAQPTPKKQTVSAEAKKALDNVNKKISDILASDKIKSLSEQERADLRSQLVGMQKRVKMLYGIKG